tara:strand:+ start:218 stop:343 length:126 start_codon:yes stop_codon:yes gene_type:complete
MIMTESGPRATPKFNQSEKIDSEFLWYKDENGARFIGYSEK